MQHALQALGTLYGMELWVWWHEQLPTIAQLRAMAQLPIDENGLSLFDELDDAFVSELVDEPGDAQWRGLQEGHDLLGRVGSWR